jgi:hypothetical protein
MGFGYWKKGMGLMCDLNLMMSVLAKTQRSQFFVDTPQQCPFKCDVIETGYYHFNVMGEGYQTHGQFQHNNISR